MRILLIGLAALTLAGCHAAAPDAPNDAATNEAAVESEFQNEPAALAASIENDANTDDADDDTNVVDAADRGHTAYSCDNGTVLTVAYTDSDASLTTGGKTLTL